MRINWSKLNWNILTRAASNGFCGHYIKTPSSREGFCQSDLGGRAIALSLPTIPYQHLRCSNQTKSFSRECDRSWSTPALTASERY